MAESVDALVSNTSGFTSIPVRPRVWVQGESSKAFSFFLCRFLWISEMMVYLCHTF